jgi:hypothetical protein
MQQHVVELLLGRPFGQPQIVVEFRRLEQRPDLLADRRQLGRVKRGDVGMFVEQLLQARDVAVRFGARHRRDEVVDEHRVGAALSLRAFTGVVDQERIDQRQITQRSIRGACR